MARTTTPRPTRRPRAARQAAMIFGRHNYALLLGAVALIVAGFAMMRLENEVDGFISLYVSPLVLIAGYALVVRAVLWQPPVQAEE